MNDHNEYSSFNAPDSLNDRDRQRAVRMFVRTWSAALFLALILFNYPVNSFAASTSQIFDFSGINLSIPDGNGIGISDSRTINAGTNRITELQVTLCVTGAGSGGFNGDIYATLTHDSGFSVLLNRVGRRADDIFGYSDNGLNIRLSDDAANGDDHIYRLTLAGSHDVALVAPPLTGTWAPDGRQVDPDAVDITSNRTALLSRFKGINPSGTWTLFIADLMPGGEHKLVSWGLDIKTQIASEITWATPSAITYGTSLSSAQLNATATVAGSMDYSPASGTMLNAGTQTLTARFTPTDTINYKGATSTVSNRSQQSPINDHSRG